MGLHIWFAAMVGMAAGLALAAAVRREAAWLAAAAFVAGASAQLGLTEPLWFGSLQLRPHGAFGLLCYATVAAQAGIAAALLLTGGRLAAFWRGTQAIGAGRVALLCLLLLGSLVAPMGFLHRHEYAAFGKQLIAAATFLAINGATLAAFAMLLPERWLLPLSVAIDRVSASTGKTLPWAAALWVFAVTLLLNLLAFDRMPRIPDEVAYLFQAKTFALGRLYVPAPGGAMAAALGYDWIAIADGKWYSIFPPGWPAVLAIGVALGSPFLVNPAIAALTVPVGHAFVSRWVSPRLAILVTLLLAVSPWYLATGASLMSHSLTLLLVLSAWLLMLTEGSRRPAAWFAAGCLMGWLFLTRPLEGLTIGVLTGLWAMTRADLKSPRGWMTVGAYGLGCAIVGALVFPYNRMLTGDIMATPIDRYFDLLWHPGANRLGFGADIGSPDRWGGVDIWPGHLPLEALIQAQFNLRSLNIELLGWATGSLTFAFAHFVWGRLSRADWCMVAVIAVTVGAYALYWFNGGFYIGPRYWFMALWPALFLTARGIQTTTGLLRGIGVFNARERVAAFALLLTAVAILSFLPWRATTRYWEFRGFHDGYREMARSGAFDRSLVFVRNGEDMGEYGSAFMLNTPDLTGPLFLRDRGAVENAAMAARYPGRTVVIVDDGAVERKKGPARP